MARNPGRVCKWGAVLGAALLVVIQFVPVDRTNPPVVSDLSAPAPVREIIVRACYDCHSHQTRWPWYSRIAPVSWWTAEHVREGRRDLNFSRWPVFDFNQQDLLLREIAAQVDQNRMPPFSYRLGHPAARLTEAERDTLLAWTSKSGGANDALW